MKKLIHYILIGIMLNWNVAVFAADDPDCDWKTFEETDTYVMENCVTENGYSARVRQKPIDGVNIEIVEAPKKKANPIQEFKDKVEEAPKATAKVEKMEKIEEEVIVTEKKIEELKEEKTIPFKLMLGHAGWSAKQLEREIENGDWLIQSTNPDFIFSTGLSKMWRSALKSLGIDLGINSGSGGEA